METGSPFLRGLPSHTKVKPFARQRQYCIFFHCCFQTLSIGPVPGIELATSSSTGQRFNDWAHPAVAFFGFLIAIFLLFQKQRPAFVEVLRVFFVYLPCETSKTKLICDLPPLVFALLCLTLPVQEHTKFKFLDDIPTFCLYRPLSAAQMAS